MDVDQNASIVMGIIFCFQISYAGLMPEAKQCTTAVGRDALGPFVRLPPKVLE